MKIEIEGSREDVLDILKAIAGIPKTILKEVKTKKNDEVISDDPVIPEGGG